MKKVIIFFICFAFFDLNTVQSVAYEVKLTNKQKDLISSYYDCNDEGRLKHYYSIKFRLTDIPIMLMPKNQQCSLEYAKLIYKSFDLVQDKNRYYDYHWYRYRVGLISIAHGNENQVMEGFKLLENMFNDPIYEKNILIEDTKHINYFKSKVASSLGWAYNTKIGFFDKKKALKHLNYCANLKIEKTDVKTLQYCLNNLGTLYDQGRFVEFNYKKAYQLYKKSADMGNHWANGNIAKFYLFGLGGIEKSYEKAVRHYKLARISDLGNEQFIDLLILYDKERVPNSIAEYMQWLEEFTIKGQDGHGFQQLAWLAEDNQHNIKGKITAYKWHYLASRYSPDKDDRERSPQEMHIMEKETLNEKQINEAVMQAEAWIKKNWKN